jgi:hypothetical protein
MHFLLSVLSISYFVYLDTVLVLSVILKCELASLLLLLVTVATIVTTPTSRIILVRNVAVEWLAISLRFQELLDSNAGTEASRPGRGFSLRSSTPPRLILVDCLKLSNDSFHILYTISLINHPVILRYVILATESAVK